MSNMKLLFLKSKGSFLIISFLFIILKCIENEKNRCYNFNDTMYSFTRWESLDVDDWW